MTPPDADPYGSKDNRTEYEGQRQSTSRSGYAKSAWALAIGAMFLALVVGWLLFHPARTDPAPGGSAGNGVVTTPAPTSSKP
jgi:hypothetical protein